MTSFVKACFACLMLRIKLELKKITTSFLKALFAYLLFFQSFVFLFAVSSSMVWILISTDAQEKKSNRSLDTQWNTQTFVL